MADQEKPVRRRVALKIIKVGMDTKEVVARFEQERQALALMEHPNIAKVFDAGATQYGRPFFVMELVKGVRITDYCDQSQLSTSERLKLFMAVCQAVQHAHQKGIIHRDLKPSNVLVTLHDGVPVPKVIDFGVAKATQQQRLTDLTLFTQFEQMVGTPLYMSPEQAELSGLDIDTRSDIYSLGVLLYELLAGRTPFDPARLMQAGYDEMRRVIREEEPQKPSTFLSTMALELRTTVAKHRSAEGAKLISSIRGDLDWIVMKAIEKDRNRRYETANGLAKDIERHLEGEPVQARPPSFGYRTGKLIRRHRGAFAAAAAVLLALLGGLAASTVLYLREKKAWAGEAAQRQKAEASERTARTEAAKSQQTAKFMAEMLSGVDPEQAKGRDITLLKEILDRAAKRVETELKDQPEVEAMLHLVIGNTYRELGLYSEAQSHLEPALAIRQRVLGAENFETFDAMGEVASLYFRQGKLLEAERLLRRVVECQTRLLGPEYRNTLSLMSALAMVLDRRAKYDEAEALGREIFELRKKTLGPEHRETLVSMNNLAGVYQREGKSGEAETLKRAALEISTRVFGSEHPLTLAVLGNQITHSPAEAEAVASQVLGIKKRVLGPEHPDTLTAMSNLAVAYGEQGKFHEAEALQREVLESRKRLLGMEHPDTFHSIACLASWLEGQQKHGEAETLFREALEGRSRLQGPEHPDTLFTMRGLANCLYLSGDAQAALTLQAQYSAQTAKDTIFSLGVAALEVWFGRDPEHLATCRKLFAEAQATDVLPNKERAAKAYCLRPSSDPALLEQALGFAQQAVELGAKDVHLAWYELALGMAQYRRGDSAAAGQTLRAAEQAAKGNALIAGPAQLFRAMSLFQQDRKTEAHLLFAEAEAQMRALPSDERWPLREGSHDHLVSGSPTRRQRR